MKEISVKELKQRLDSEDNIQIIDIREDWEVERATIGGLHIPMGELCDNLNLLEKNSLVILHCKTGGRSKKMAQFLETNYNLKNIYSLKGGIEAWANEINKNLKID